MTITVRALESLKVGQWLTEPGNRNEGALRAKGSLHGPRFYFRYRNGTGNYDDLPLGSFDASGRRGMKLADARDKVAELRRRYLRGDRDLRSALEAEERERSRARQDAEAAALATAARERATLGALLGAYVGQLQRDRKPSARSVERALARHVAKAWPILWETPAELVTPDDLLSVVAKLVDEEKPREAAKLRSYLRAAYSAAIRARQDARALPTLRALRVTTNPARDLVTVEGASKARSRALSVSELRAYWKRICSAAGPDGALLRFHLLTGAQRCEQLGRVRVEDLDSDLQVVRLRDGKGRRKVAREHVVPLIPAAQECLHVMAPHRHGPHLVTVTSGVSGAVYATFQHRLREVVAAMAGSGELEKGAFSMGDLRRTVETRLAAEGISGDVRAQLQSHGLGGIQARHYDRHDYVDEKRAALETLHRLLTGKGASVVPISRRAKAR